MITVHGVFSMVSRKYEAQFRISFGKGLFCGGAQRTTAVMRQSVSLSPSFGPTEWGLFAYPARWSARYSQSPLRSPVNIRPVRFAPWAAGAKPTTRREALGSPKFGTGRVW